MLKLQGVHAWYGRAHVLQGVELEVAEGEIVCLIGRNGAGKTTTLKAIMGLLGRCEGSIRFGGRELQGRPTYERFLAGLGYVPEERRIVSGLSVLENIRLGLLKSPAREPEAAVIARIAERFPRLKERLSQAGDTLSGGEQQMLAIARAVASKPKLVMLDEPTEGIMPIIVEELAEFMVELRRQGTTILLVEQNVELALGIADRAYVMDQGVIVHADSAAALLADREIQERYCSV